MKRVTSLLLIFVLATGSMSAFISDRACKYGCCQQDMDCCVGNNKMKNCSLSAGTDTSSPNLIVSGPKPRNCRQDNIDKIADLTLIQEGNEMTFFLASLNPEIFKVPIYSRYGYLLI
ncbi:MAG: hypothetical protein CMG71_02425 [Candidatus Marinimicrobia bacterium]|nr:hypothetical protein [Candidatus Neomarinimicrobiota bacterium]